MDKIPTYAAKPFRLLVVTVNINVCHLCRGSITNNSTNAIITITNYKVKHAQGQTRYRHHALFVQPPENGLVCEKIEWHNVIC